MISYITKILHRFKSILVPVLSVAVIVALALGGQGGRITLTVFGQTAAPVRGGQLVVGYLLTQEILKREEAHKAEALRVGSLRKPAAWEEGRAREVSETLKGIPLDIEDYQTLLRIVEAEAGVCDSKGKILVANVVLNRVRSGEFPNTIREVVYQPSQFSPVSNGSINTCQVTSQTIECVRRALEGEDYSQGALYFMNRGASESGAVSWFDGRLTFLFRHGGHEFFK